MKMKVFLLILIALTVLGCLAESPELRRTPTSSEVPAITPSPTPAITPAPVQTPTPTPTLQFGVKYPAKVIYVYDGDTIKVKSKWSNSKSQITGR